MINEKMAQDLVALGIKEKDSRNSDKKERQKEKVWFKICDSLYICCYYIARLVLEKNNLGFLFLYLIFQYPS